MKIYVASSWRNEHQPEVVRMLRGVGHEVFDFRNPKKGVKGFSWSEVSDKHPNDWTTKEFLDALDHDRAIEAFNIDFKALESADLVVLVLPCGRSSHLEAGFAKGRRRTLVVFIPPKESVTPELMYSLADYVVHDMARLVEVVQEQANGRRRR